MSETPNHGVPDEGVEGGFDGAEDGGGGVAEAGRVEGDDVRVSPDRHLGSISCGPISASSRSEEEGTRQRERGKGRDSNSREMLASWRILISGQCQCQVVLHGELQLSLSHTRALVRARFFQDASYYWATFSRGPLSLARLMPCMKAN